jgi:hypothetical protein
MFAFAEYTAEAYWRQALQASRGAECVWFALQAAKIGCGEGGCGACSVLCSSYDAGSGTTSTRVINACLAPVAALDGCAITTSQGLGNSRAGHHPVQGGRRARCLGAWRAVRAGRPRAAPAGHPCLQRPSWRGTAPSAASARLASCARWRRRASAPQRRAPPPAPRRWRPAWTATCAGAPAGGPSRTRARWARALVLEAGWLAGWLAC